MVENRLSVSIKNLRMQTPIMTASGTSGSSDEMAKLLKSKSIAESLGAFVSKAVTLKPRLGNPGLRLVEIQSGKGIINSIGLQNKGVKDFLDNDLPLLLQYESPIIINISANRVEDYGEVADYLIENDVNKIIAGLEINVSCPNIREKGKIFGVDPNLVERVVKTVKRIVGDDIVIITKLTPNVTDITEPAKAAIAGGTDSLSMINTLKGMAIDLENKRPFLENEVGGLSGPAIKPIGIFMVYECFKKINECRNKSVPIVGIGGISTWRDALEYIMAGATAVGIGTAWLVNNNVFCEVKKGLMEYLEKNNTTIKDLIGVAHKKKKI
jgi:dihydroorotate dehydrogenase (NAD+) catalytic subunit